MERVLTPKEILQIKKCGDLFSSDAEKRKTEYFQLMKQYKEVSGVGQHISMLYQKSSELAAAGRWEADNSVSFKTNDNRTIRFRYLKHHGFELGELFISPQHIMYRIAKEKFVRQMYRQTEGLSFSGKDMENTFEPLLPHIEAEYRTIAGEQILLISKNPDEFLLADVLEATGQVPQKQAAWVISRLLSFCCFLAYNRLVHNGIHKNNLLISPEYHQVRVCGGWWYCVEEGSPLIGIMKDVFDLMPIRAKSDKIGCSTTDLECVKGIGRQLLGDEIEDIPKPFYQFLQDGSSDDAMYEFQKWDDVLTRSYGPRKFIKWPITAEQIYSI